ncbi:MAG TPA: sugar ABC transporter permease [Actinospica sp.]|nr:sugar ABC transporter permease [Actinospica sp.]
MAGTIPRMSTTATNQAEPAVPAARAARRAGRKAVKARSSGSGSPLHRGDWRLAWLLVAPAAVGFVVFAVYPLVRGVFLSFTSFHVLSPARWTGLANYRELVHDSTFWSSVEVTVYFVVLSVGVGIFFSLVTAVVMHRLTRSSVIRGLVLLPFLISGVVAALVWSWMLQSQLGIISIWLQDLTGHEFLFLGSSGWAIPTVALINVWKSMGYNAVLLFAGLQMIPGDVYEAARLDGAGEVRIFRRITLPLLRPVLAMVVILTIIGSFQVFDIVQVATPNGGTADSSNVLPLYIYQKAFSQFDFGYASTMSVALFVLLLAVTFLQMRLTRANETDLS